MTNHLFTFRPATATDAEAVANIVIASDQAQLGTAEYSLADLHDDWQRVGFDPTTDTQLALTAEGQLVGYANIWERKPGEDYYADGYTHPDYEGRGIGTQLVHWIETRAKAMLSRARLTPQPHTKPAHLIHYVHHTCAPARELFESHSWRPVRYAWRMLIEMESPPPTPHWPDGIRIRTYQPGEEQLMYTIVNEAFSDLDDFNPMSFDAWSSMTFGAHDFDPSLYFVAHTDAEIAGVALGFKWPEMGWVRHLAVRRPFRKHGLGLALLHHAFGEFYQRGERKVGLGVDSQNATGATRLYVRAGMKQVLQFDQYQKDLA